MKIFIIRSIVFCLLFYLFIIIQPSVAGSLSIGCSSIDITPSRPVALAGNFSTRISKEPETPIIAAALALESKDGDKPVQQALIISCDLVAIRDGVQEKFRSKLQPLLPDMDMQNVILTATHTHTAPLTMELHEKRYVYDLPQEGVMMPDDYVEFLIEKLSTVAVNAWKNRKPAGVSWTLGYAVVGQNRRAVYADGRAKMYGKSDDPQFRGLEGYEDHAVEMLFFWDNTKQLKAIAINLACPAQEVESGRRINADFWHEVRQQLKSKLNQEDLVVLGWTGAAGDQSPHLMYRKTAEGRMTKARGLTRVQEIGRRISNAVIDTIEPARADIRNNLLFAHTVRQLQLPPRKILKREYEEALKNIPALEKKTDNYSRSMLIREKDVVHRYEDAQKIPPYNMELHVLRIGDIAIATNPFELFIDYGTQIKARSQAVQTFIIQHACNAGLYLPTPRAIEGGHYSGWPHTNIAGPEGGQVLVEETVKSINELFKQ
ncbi:MAG: hypothetical protein A2283_20255 [Lentisphaerae bacterium RIFOXYA12_FULL_48_11]|nr:MAG: hypothetical protein A2283_20255 [Lentisphaerae bacterium RIFOXYA12_FULL_48_11]